MPAWARAWLVLGDRLLGTESNYRVMSAFLRAIGSGCKVSA